MQYCGVLMAGNMRYFVAILNVAEWCSGLELHDKKHAIRISVRNVLTMSNLSSYIEWYNRNVLFAFTVFTFFSIELLPITIL